jgi:hypothetical protein
MADSPTKVPPDNKPEEKEPTYSYKDVHETPPKEIAANQEIPEEKPPETDEQKAEREAKEKADAEAKAKEEAKKEEVEIAPEQMAEEIAAKAAEKLAEKQAKKKEKTAKDKYTEFFEKTKKEKGREPTYIEYGKFLEEEAVKTIEAKQEKVEKDKQAEIEGQKKIDEEMAKRMNAQIDEELDELYKSGSLTPIKDPKNPSDQGIIERKALFQAMLDTNQQRATEGKPPILSVQRIFYGGYYTKPSAQPAGENAPVSMGQGTPANQGEEQEVDYVKDVHKPWNVFKKIIPGQ